MGNEITFIFRSDDETVDLDRIFGSLTTLNFRADPPLGAELGDAPYLNWRPLPASRVVMSLSLRLSAILRKNRRDFSGYRLSPGEDPQPDGE
jgi:hypothetical protein